jgi:hypothetical protein
MFSPRKLGAAAIATIGGDLWAYLDGGQGQRTPDLGADPADHAVGSEPIAAAHALVNDQPGSVQGCPCRIVQRRAVEVEPTTDVHPNHVHLIGIEPISEFQVAAGLQLVGGKSWQVAAGQAHGLGLRLPQVGGLLRGSR